MDDPTLMQVVHSLGYLFCDDFYFLLFHQLTVADFFLVLLQVTTFAKFRNHIHFGVNLKYFNASDNKRVATPVENFCLIVNSRVVVTAHIHLHGLHSHLLLGYFVFAPPD